MNSDPQATKVWESVLPEIRRKRRRRNAIKLSAVSICLMAIAWIPFAVPRSQVTETKAAIIDQQFADAKHETLAVMRVGDDGVVRLEEIGTDQLGSIELAFGLTPLISHSDLESNAGFPSLDFHQ